MEHPCCCWRLQWDQAWRPGVKLTVKGILYTAREYTPGVKLTVKGKDPVA
jgi:hypothetical protein